jgi:hypothetical protein
LNKGKMPQEASWEGSIDKLEKVLYVVDSMLPNVSKRNMAWPEVYLPMTNGSYS